MVVDELRNEPAARDDGFIPPSYVVERGSNELRRQALASHGRHDFGVGENHHRVGLAVVHNASDLVVDDDFITGPLRVVLHIDHRVSSANESHQCAYPSMA
jgi:hypothetical protein